MRSSSLILLFTALGCGATPAPDVANDEAAATHDATHATDTADPTDHATPDDDRDVVAMDESIAMDATTNVDASSPDDSARARDATTPHDAGTAHDAATPHDASTTHDAAVAQDAAVDAGSPIPTGDLPHWHRVFGEDFTTPIATGSFPGTPYAAHFTVYPDGWTDNSHQVTYMGSRTLSTHDGMLDVYIHTEGTTRMCAAFIAHAPTQTYGRYTFRYRSDAVPDYGAVFLLWPDDNQWPVHGELDFPEGNLDGTMAAHAHYADTAGGQDSFETHHTWPAWHIATVEWSPGLETYILDGVTVGTSTHEVPTTPLHQVFQCGSGSGALPSATASGHLLIDWMVIYTRTG